MKEYLVRALHSRLSLILNFVNGKSKKYDYKDLFNGTETEILNVVDLPCEFFLLLGDKTLVTKSKNSLLPEVQKFIFDVNKSFEFFTGDNLHPVPNKKGYDVDNYNPTTAFYAMKKGGDLWVKKSGEVRIEYLNHLLSNLVITEDKPPTTLHKLQNGFILSTPNKENIFE